MEDYDPFLVLQPTPDLDQAIHDDHKKQERISENSEICTIIFGRDTFFPFVYLVTMDYESLEKKYPFTCRDGGPFHCAVLFDVKTNMTRDPRIHDAIRGYYFGATIHILKGEWIDGRK